MTKDGLAKLKYDEALYLLKVFYKKALDMIDAVALNHFFNIDSILNDYYISTLFIIKELLKRNDLEHLRNGTGKIFPSIIGHSDIDTEWELGRDDAYDFLSQIEINWRESGKPNITIPKELQEKFDDIDRAISNFKDYTIKADRTLMEDYGKKVEIKQLRLDDKNYLLEINSGKIIISFKSKKGKQGLEKETKLFKLLFLLWDYRWEVKNGKITLKGDYATLENLKRGSGSVSTEATHKAITRLNELFQDKGVPISIEGKNESYRLVVNFS